MQPPKSEYKCKYTIQKYGIMESMLDLLLHILQINISKN